MAPAVGRRRAIAPLVRPACRLRRGQGCAAAADAPEAAARGRESVGERFADEARAIHLGEAEARAIHGAAPRRDEAESLIEEGVPIAPLPFPVVGPGEEN